MTATDELRRLLDERGVEWGNVRNDGSKSDYLTEWQFKDNRGKAIATEWAVGSGLSVEIHRYHLTPEQAIAATLGNDGVGRTNDGLADLQAENAKLREYIERKRLLQDFARLVNENAKLRELVRDYEHCTMHADCSRCEYDGKLSTHCPLSPCFPDADELCELGVEVDG